jgi:hypothetical protein
MSNVYEYKQLVLNPEQLPHLHDASCGGWTVVTAAWDAGMWRVLMQRRCADRRDQINGIPVTPPPGVKRSDYA